MLADFIYDPFVPQQLQENGFLPVHYQAPLVEGNDAYMTIKSGALTSNWATQVWNVTNLRWTNGKLVQQWSVTSDWKPVPVAEAGGGPFFEPVFHPILAGDVLWTPGVSGSLLAFDRFSGVLIRRVNPFSTLDPNTYVSGPLAADSAGNVYYNAIQFNAAHPWTNDVVNAWLVKVRPDGSSSRATYNSITPNTPHATDMCLGVFTSALPWPPSPTAVPPSVTCGSQRPGVNVAPAIASDGTIYTVSRAHLNSRWGYLVAVNPDLTPKWVTSMRDRFNDGCNVLIPPNGTPGGCRAGAHTGVDPSDNTPGAGAVNDNSSSCPVVAPDGSIFYGAYTRYNYAQGHMTHFSPTGQFLGGYRFGWDITPAIWPHDGTYSLITKENHYGEAGSYCGDPTVCPTGRTAADPEQYLITRLSPSLDVEWQFKSTNTKSCERLPNGSLECFDDHPDGFEWCVNAPAVDANGMTYVNSEDGFLYAIDTTGHENGKIFLQLAIGAAYTPLSIDPAGRIFTQNAGHLFVVGETGVARRRAVTH